MAVDVSTDVESDVFWTRLARHSGSFRIECRDGSHHQVRWDPPPNKKTAAGVIGYYIHEARCSATPSIKLEYTKQRIHVCRNDPCTAEYGPSKYGALPPPVAHCRVLRLGGTERVASEGVVSAAAEEASSSTSDSDHETSSSNSDSDSPEQEPDMAVLDIVACADAVGRPQPPLPPPPLPPLVVDEADVTAIMARAAAVGQPRVTTGFFDFIVFAAMRRRRLLLRLPDGAMDMVSVFAPHIISDDWSVGPFVVQVVACRAEDNVWVMSGLAHASHFYAGVPVPATAIQGSDAVSQCSRRGIAAIETVADGDCGLDVLCMADGRQRNLTTRTILRAEIRSFMISLAGDPRWHAIWHNCQEHLVQATPADAGKSAAATSGAAPAAPAEAAKSAAARGGAAPEVPQPPPPPLPGVSLASSGPSPPASADAEKGEHQELVAAVRWGTGLPHPSEALVRRLASELTH